MVAHSQSLLFAVSIYCVCTTNMASANANVSFSKCFLTGFSIAQMGSQIRLVFLSVSVKLRLRLAKATDAACSRRKQLVLIQRRDIQALGVQSCDSTLVRD